MKLCCSVDSDVAWPQTLTFFIPSHAPNVLFLRASAPPWWIPSRSACLMLEIMLVLFLCLTCPGARADEPAGVRGVITDPTGAVIRGATVDLLQGSTRIASTTTGREGAFQLTAPRAGHYFIRAAAEGFTAQQSGLVYVGTGRTVLENLTLSLGTVSQHVVVTATGVPVPESQVGASVSVICSIDTPNTAVLPLPVLDLTIRSSLFKICGIALLCTSVGSMKPISSIAFKIGSAIPNSLKLLFIIIFFHHNEMCLLYSKVCQR